MNVKCIRTLYLDEDMKREIEKKSNFNLNLLSISHRNLFVFPIYLRFDLHILSISFESQPFGPSGDRPGKMLMHHLH